MQIKNVTAKNFRTLKDVSINFQSFYCTLSGQNNAGKSAIVRIIRHFLEDDETRSYRDERLISYDRDATQWDKGPILISIDVELHRENDSELYFFLSAFTPAKLEDECAKVHLEARIEQANSEIRVSVDGTQLEARASLEVLKKFRSASNLMIHNSTHPARRYYYQGDELVEFVESQFSAEDNKKISDAQVALHNRVRSAARKHRDALSEYVGKLRERYSIELVPPERTQSASIPLTIRLTDRSVEVPLHEWGTGTQNRTRALMSVFGAARARNSASPADRVTAVVLIEEPESFLHPSAQAEFGKLLNQLASEVSIQIIATTHSPYMLNQTEPEANILLERKTIRGLPRETQVIETVGDGWMRPFANNLGVVPEEFSPLRDVFKTTGGRVILVEGAIDKEYFDHIKESYPSVYRIPAEVEVIPYGGKDTLKNTTLLKFVLARFDRVFLTFDLDADRDCAAALCRLGLNQGKDFCAIGVQKAGQTCIEGLLPEAVKKSVFSANPELVMAMGGEGSDRKKAKDQLKQKMLEEFKRIKLPDSELKAFKDMFSAIAKFL